ncbi:unnamed protein product [Bursaphelenchus okinawaensis]|uniref:E3 ubiquitin-protein ligase ZNRF1 n=1 Tax=Bursaphelenchus okinawaensis TaxID=465554 RepID=A0A811JV08_9BILA|nr:unnamed protein product [Bursaphelenchus okinawaensis]CAG9084932.1 unnamed protein product [Bursaphelenchus okinawaensis]
MLLARFNEWSRQTALLCVATAINVFRRAPKHEIQDEYVGERERRDVKCPVCHKRIPSDEAEVHLVMCFTRPKIAYNEDVLSDEKGECAICLEEMDVGQTIARLPCLCIYHKKCIDDWFRRKNCCPEHPGDD